MTTQGKRDGINWLLWKGHKAIGFVIGLCWVYAFTLMAVVLLYPGMVIESDQAHGFETLFYLALFAILSAITGLLIALPRRAPLGVLVGAGSGALVFAILWFLTSIQNFTEYSAYLQTIRSFPWQVFPMGLIVGGACAFVERAFVRFASSYKRLAIVICGAFVVGVACALMPLVFIVVSYGIMGLIG